MKRNEEIMQDFISGNESKNVNLRAFKNSLINYTTKIAYKEGNMFYVNSRKYSTTTTKIQTQLKRMLQKNNLEYKIY